MNRTVFEFPRARSRRKQAKQGRLSARATSAEILKVVADLRADLRSIKNAIRAVEYLASVELKDEGLCPPRRVSAKRAYTSQPKRENRLTDPRPSSQSKFETLD
jgi:hypothetical protein